MTHINPALPNIGDTNWGGSVLGAFNTIVTKINTLDDTVAAGTGSTGTGGTTTPNPHQAINVTDYGVVADTNMTGTNGTDNTTGFRNAALAAHTQRRDLFIPAGRYRVTGTISLPGSMKTYGLSSGSTTIYCSTPNVPVLASRGWLENTDPWGNTQLQGLEIRSTGSTGGANGHALVWRDYYGTVRDVAVGSVSGDGFHLTVASQNGSIVASTLVENRFESIVSRNTGGYGFFGGEDDSNKLTDGFITQYICVPSATSINGLTIGSAAGWQVTGVHAYARPAQQMLRFHACYATIMDDLYVEDYPAGYNAISVNVQTSVQIGMVTGFMNATGDPFIRFNKNSYPAGPGSAQVSQLGIESIPGQTTSGYATVNEDSLLHVTIGQYFCNDAANIPLVSPSSAKIRSGEGIASAFGQALVNRGDSTEIRLAASNRVAFGGTATALTFTLPLPVIYDYEKRTLLVSVTSFANHSGAARCVYSAIVHVSAKLNPTDAWAYTTQVLGTPTGFTTNPTITATKDSNSGPTGYGMGYGHLTVTFTPSSADGYGDVNFISV